MKVEKDKWKIEVSDGYCSWEYTWRKGEPINVSIIDIVEEAQKLLGFVDEAECTSISLPRRGRKVLLVYEFPGNAEAVKFDKKIYNQDNYITSYDYGNNQIVVYVLDIPEDRVNSINKALDGFYSEMDIIDKLTISKFWLSLTDSTIVTSIFNEDHSDIKLLWDNWGKNREELCQEGEYWFKPKFDEELFSIEEY